VQWLFPIVGVLLLAWGIRKVSGPPRNHTQTATAEIMERRWAGHGRSRRMVPVVRFALPDGRIVETEVRAGANPLANWEGHEVAVHYDPDDPAQVRVGGPLGTYDTGGLTAIAGGVVLLVIGLPMVF
jgi:hypothetical protein